MMLEFCALCLCGGLGAVVRHALDTVIHYHAPAHHAGTPHATGLKEIPVCVAYDVELEDGTRKRYEDMPVDQAHFAAATPVYETMPGWDEDISRIHDFDSLPRTTRDYVKRLEELSGCRISAIGTGPQRDHIIEVHSLVD